MGSGALSIMWPIPVHLLTSTVVLTLALAYDLEILSHLLYKLIMELQLVYVCLCIYPASEASPDPLFKFLCCLSSPLASPLSRTAAHIASTLAGWCVAWTFSVHSEGSARMNFKELEVPLAVGLKSVGETA